MFFTIIRLIFFVLIFIIGYLFVIKSKTVYKLKWTIVAVIVAIIITTVSALIPIENALVTFSSAESAYKYNHYGDVKLIITGEKSDFVIGKKGDTDIYAIVPKSKEGWKIGRSLKTQRVIEDVSEDVVIYIYQYDNTNDYFITILDTNGGTSEIIDNRNSEFKYVEKSNSTLEKTFYTYYAYINDFDNQYLLTVNGKLIDLQDK